MENKGIIYILILFLIFKSYNLKAKVTNDNSQEKNEENVNLESIDITIGEMEIEKNKFLKNCNKFENKKIYRRDLLECFFLHFFKITHYDSFKNRNYYHKLFVENLKAETETVRDYLKNKILIDFFKKIKGLYISKSKVEKIIKENMFVNYFKHRFDHLLLYNRKLKHQKEEAHLYKDPEPFHIDL